MIKKSLALIFCALLSISLAAAQQATLVGEAPVGKYYFEGVYHSGSDDNELDLELLFVPTAKEEGGYDRAVFTYRVYLTEETCACVVRKNYAADGQLLQEYHYERLILVPLSNVNTVSSALKLIREQSQTSAGGQKFTVAEAMQGLQDITSWLNSFRALTQRTGEYLSDQEKIQIGNLGWDMQNIGFNNKVKSLEGTLRVQKWEIRKLEYELAMERNLAGKIPQEALTQAAGQLREAQKDWKDFLDNYHAAD